MKILTAHTIERTVTTLMIASILSITGVLFYFLSLRLGNIAKENQAYNRYSACILSIPSNVKSVAEIDRCYKEAQKDTGKIIKRYDVQ